jgi:hypothetical protein
MLVPFFYWNFSQFVMLLTTSVEDSAASGLTDIEDRRLRED